MHRIGMVIGIRPEKIAEYKALHAAVWPTVLARLRKSNIRNYSIFLREPENLLFSYFEYHGNDFDADMKVIEADPDTQRWWQLTEPCQRALDLPCGKPQWLALEQVFLMD